MSNLEQKISNLTSKEKNASTSVEIFNLSKESERAIVEEYIQAGKIEYIVDEYLDQLEELEETQKPEVVAQKFEQTYTKPSLNTSILDGIWVYYPWKKTLVHILKEKEFIAVRNSRNFNLITQEEQKMFASSVIGIAGLNVGHPGAICLALEGGARNLKIADFDPLSLANLNRFRAGLCDLGTNKAILTARQLHEIDPYYTLDVYDKGITPENMNDFMTSPKLDLLIEETDNLVLKIKLREVAKKNKIPVLMVTGSGAGLVIDIERYDTEENGELLNGHLSEGIQKDIFQIKPGETKFEDLIALLRDFIGEKHLDDRLVKSFPEIGKTLAGIPQLSEASFLRGACLCYFARQIVTGGNAPSGRYIFNMDSIVKDLGV